MHAADMLVLLQATRELTRILALSLHPKRKCLQSTQNLVRFPNAEHAADQLHHAEQRGRIHLIARDDESAHRIGVTAQILRRTMDHEISAELQRLAKIRRGKSVIDDQSRAVLMRDLNARFDVANL